MIHWKLIGVRGEVNDRGFFRPIKMTMDDYKVGDVDSREEALDSLDTWACIIRDTLPQPGFGVMMSLYEYETFAEKEGKLLSTILIVRGYREAGKDPETGEIRYERDEDDKPMEPTYCRYEKQYTKFLSYFNMNFDVNGNIIDDDGKIIKENKDLYEEVDYDDEEDEEDEDEKNGGDK